MNQVRSAGGCAAHILHTFSDVSLIDTDLFFYGKPAQQLLFININGAASHIAVPVHQYQDTAFCPSRCD